MAAHPCVQCGACCSFFRVEVSLEENQAQGIAVPMELTAPLVQTSERNKNRVMKGTDQERPRCVALAGKVGTNVFCTIYEQRPACCRNFKASYENGERNSRCDKARILKGLKPLELR